MNNNDEPYSTNSNIYDFLEHEFLHADDQTFKLIKSYYFKHYGGGAGNYFINTYDSWKHGSTRISSLTFGRIIRCMPKFLTEEKRFFILKAELEKFFEQQKKDIKRNQTVSKNKIDAVYIQLQEKILQFGEKDLEWFIGRDIFTEEQVNHYLKLCRFVLNEKLIQSYRHIASDLEFIRTSLIKPKDFITEAFYTTLFADQKLSLEDIMLLRFDINIFKKIDFKLDESFKKFGERYFLNELMKISFKDSSNSTSMLVKSNDINVFLAHFLEVKNQSTTKVSMKSTYEGEGGILSLSLDFIPLSLLKRMIYISFIKIFCYSILPIIILLMNLEYWIIISIIIFVFAVSGLINEIGTEFQNLIKMQKKIKIYGK